ncbi:hypothetical protein QBC43DRAFT_332534 [Cladorrhinum sp. PSN259]|nr:hypothetical protein QBC43DRAFT_332534 [Cladorrhinum sp. PSN259]
METLEQPEIRDYYADLGSLPQSATPADIKAAWFKLAKQHHPDKKALGQVTDANEFRRIREAYDVLRNPSTRTKYDAQYPKVKSLWTLYHTQIARRRKLEAQIQAEAASRRKQAAAAAAKAKTEAEAQNQAKLQEARRLEKTRLAEIRSQEAARRLHHLERQKAAKDRSRLEQLKSAEILSTFLQEETRTQLWEDEMKRRKEEFGTVKREFEVRVWLSTKNNKEINKENMQLRA